MRKQTSRKYGQLERIIMKVKDKRLRKRMTRNQSLEGLLGEGVAEERLLIVGHKQ